ncbi:MAG: hypothetical protein MUO31_06615 [Thermodesulfovibrionales bacterium]|nr:hypothetical protein [Thermodesulfovibrionales bacterium]
MILEPDKCEKCDEQSDTLIKCQGCGTMFCPDCDKTKKCEMCGLSFCNKCYVIDVCASPICHGCFDHLFVIKANYESLTKQLADITNEASNVEDSSVSYVIMLGRVTARLEFLKAQFEY